MDVRVVSSLGNSQNPYSITYLSQRDAAEIEDLLVGPLGFSADQLMELGGLSVAASIAEVYGSEYCRVLVICGPGNNGGVGLVAARHLHHFGYRPFVCYPKRMPMTPYTGFVTQLESLSIPLLSVEDLPQELSNDFDIFVDAILEFSFHGKPRPPFDDLIQRLVSLNSHGQTCQRSPVIVSIDIPSGWLVEEGDVDSEGIKPDMLFCKWREDAAAAGLHQPNDVALSTVDKDGNPFTNYESRKARDISENPRASLLFYWGGLNLQMWRQVRVEGTVQKVSNEESEIYFHSRPRESQIVAIVSKQSTIIPGREVFHREFRESEAKFPDGILIPRPKHWGGYRLKPSVFEFWEGQQSRLHDRLQYSLREVDGKQVWHIDRLAP
ncbi:pyridoxine/pyridoxamine 5'-phosphate oxidase 1, chloroplastic-like isoform X6 [Magnolia sinica]|uniref:pyridoxine/pyridoxamine 5'-phosphate oxidase 1, chloroplastic-like isoform X6 n=1 Tax=Magnolia sinica TaxID=86752 RepID=UPI00265A5B8D|nr:pyridoxine/pyridoxamine 5'-phosphate oxidase 1, chloroplastic-like isoform X6 [Magnolia sinica]